MNKEYNPGSISKEEGIREAKKDLYVEKKKIVSLPVIPNESVEEEIKVEKNKIINLPVVPKELGEGEK